MSRRLLSLVLPLVSLLIAIAVTGCGTGSESLHIVPAASSGGLSMRQPDRENCTQIGTSDLRSPREGVWFQTHCLAASAFPQGVASTDCNRLALQSSDFTQVADDLYVYRPTPSAPAYLWYATTPACFDIVSAKVVTAVCTDRTISFKWDVRAACADHGGVLASINAS